MVFENFTVDEADVSRAIIREFMKELDAMAETDVIIVGAGPAGAVAARKLAEQGIDTLLIEKNVKPGGGMYLGGMLMNKLVVEKPAIYLLEEVGVKSLKLYKEGLYVADAYEVSTKLLASAFDAGAKMLNAVEVADVVYRPDKIAGVVVNWHAISYLPKVLTCVDPLAFKSKMVIDATGHGAEIAKIAGRKLGFEVHGCEGSMWMAEAEKATLENTKEIYPGLIVAGMAANSAFGLPRMGPLFGAMFLSGEKAAGLAAAKLKG
ncbi:MAG: thiazole biosynthesis protein [Candidatus Diapherotrites archaeon]|nr:thiazole biosynthesis protein [Candidatus Diapherotrites archaeon]